MTAVSAWLDMMRQTVSVQEPSGMDTFGTQSYGTAATYRCRIVGKRRHVINALGLEVVSQQTVYLATDTMVSPQAKVTLSTADVGSTEAHSLTPVLLATGRYPDENGQHHTVLYL